MTTSTEATSAHSSGASARIDELDLKRKVAELLDRWPSAGLAGRRGRVLELL